MKDFYAKRIDAEGEEYWAVYETGSNQLLSVGSTITEAVDAFFTIELNEEAKRKLGLDAEDFDFR